MFCSTIIPTIGRASLTRAVQSVLDQKFDDDDFEIIVVNDSPQPLALADWMQSPRVRVVSTERDPSAANGTTPKRTTGIARNTGAKIARGTYLNFLDDDDWLLPGALQAWAGIAADKTAWLYGGYQVADDDGNVLNEFKPKLRGNFFANWVAGENIPLQASLIRADVFHTIGGFDPAIWTTEDRELCGRVALHGDLVGTTQVVAHIRVGETNSSTRGNWQYKPEMARVGREKVMNDSRAPARLKAVPLTPYWRGRLTRTFGNSMLWNLRRAHFGIAASRSVEIVRLAAPAFWHETFWNGLRFGLTKHRGYTPMPKTTSTRTTT